MLWFQKWRVIHTLSEMQFFEILLDLFCQTLDVNVEYCLYFSVIFSISTLAQYVIEKLKLSIAVFFKYNYAKRICVLLF